MKTQQDCKEMFLTELKQFIHKLDEIDKETPSTSQNTDRMPKWWNELTELSSSCRILRNKMNENKI